MGGNVNIQNELIGSPALMEAARIEDNIENVKFLLAHGTDVKATDKESYTCLHYAIRHKNIETLEFLIEKVANIEAKIFCLLKFIIAVLFDCILFL